MACQLCLEDPNTHSFVEFGYVRGCNLFYTNPANNKELNNFKKHLDFAKGHSWIFVFDCRNTFSSSTVFLMNIANILSNEHKDYLKEFWFLFPTRWTRMTIDTLSFIFPKNSIFGKSKLFYGDRVEVFDKLEKEGLHDKGFMWLTETIISDPS